MNIFTNQNICIKDIDFTRWKTINGNYLLLENASIKYMEQCLEQLYYYIDHYHGNPNVDIWITYKNYIESILACKTA